MRNAEQRFRSISKRLNQVERLILDEGYLSSDTAYNKVCKSLDELQSSLRTYYGERIAFDIECQEMSK